VGTNAKRILSRLIFLYYNPLQTAETFKKTKKKNTLLINANVTVKKNYFQQKLL